MREWIFGTITDGKLLPSLAKEGWLLNYRLIGGLNKPFLMLRAAALALRARLCQLMRLRDS